MLVQHFFPPSSTTTITNSSYSPSLSLSSPISSASLMKNKKTPILSPFFDSESTGFQPTSNENNRPIHSEKIKTHLSAWPNKLTSVMEIHRQRFSQLNPRFKQQQQQQQRTGPTFLQPVQQQSAVCPVILPSSSRPQPRQQARSKQQQPESHLPPAQLTQRSNTANAKQQQQQQSSFFENSSQYITLANLTKLLHALQTHEKINDNDTSTDTSTSTTNSTKQRVQQHLQETATRWWKSIRSSDSQLSTPVTSSIRTYAKSAALTQSLPSDGLNLQQHRQESDNLPLLTVVSNSTQQLTIPPSSCNTISKYDDSENSTEIQPVTPSNGQMSKLINTKRTRQEPSIMPARGMRLHSYNYHHYFNNQNTISFAQQQRLIRQT